jgi:hypothetical protein
MLIFMCRKGRNEIFQARWSDSSTENKKQLDAFHYAINREYFETSIDCIRMAICLLELRIIMPRAILEIHIIGNLRARHLTSYSSYVIEILRLRALPARLDATINLTRGLRKVELERFRAYYISV